MSIAHISMPDAGSRRRWRSCLNPGLQRKDRGRVPLDNRVGVSAHLWSTSGCCADWLRQTRSLPVLLCANGSLDLRFPQELHPWTKNTCARREAAGQPPKTSRRRYSDFFLDGPIFQEPDWKKKKRRNVQLSRARVGFWPLFGR